MGGVEDGVMINTCNKAKDITPQAENFKSPLASRATQKMTMSPRSNVGEDATTNATKKASISGEATFSK